jgi:hypothetical protein
MRYTPDLFDEACKRAAENLDKLDNETLALLAGPQRATPEQIDLLLKILPPDAAPPERGDTARGPNDKP